MPHTDWNKSVSIFRCEMKRNHPAPLKFSVMLGELYPSISYGIISLFHIYLAPALTPLSLSLSSIHSFNFIRFYCVCVLFVSSFRFVSKSLLLHLMMWLFAKACVSLFAIQTLSFHFVLSSFSIFMCFGVYLVCSNVSCISLLSLSLSLNIYCFMHYLPVCKYMDRGGCL